MATKLHKTVRDHALEVDRHFKWLKQVSPAINNDLLLSAAISLAQGEAATEELVAIRDETLRMLRQDGSDTPESVGDENTGVS